jgi:hypothetical protein
LKKKVSVPELRFGMYVTELDRPWTETPFRFQGFVLSSEQQLETLKKYCKSVVVDSERSTALADAARLGMQYFGKTVYSEAASVEQELGPARTAYISSHTLMQEALARVRAGRALDAPRSRTSPAVCCATPTRCCCSHSCARKVNTRSRIRSTSRST